MDQGIIDTFKTFYRNGIVKLVLESLHNKLTANITVLTAILLIDKVWTANDSQLLLKSCFIKEDQ